MMTLNITIVNQWGVWQCSDNLLSVGGKPLRQRSAKHVMFRCPDGAALLAYGGAGMVRGVHLSDWICETLRGTNRTLNATLHQIRENANVDLARLFLQEGLHHKFSIGLFRIPGRPWIYELRNYSELTPVGPILSTFEWTGAEITGPGEIGVFAPRSTIVKRDADTLLRVIDKKPRRSQDIRNLLAGINRRAAKTDVGKKIISPECFTTYLPPEGQPIESEFHGTKGSRKPSSPRMLLYGMDHGDVEKYSWNRHKGAPEDPQELERAARQAHIPRNRLRPEGA